MLIFIIFIVTILYYGLGKIYTNSKIIEGNTNSATSANGSEMKQMIKNMDKYVTNKVESKVNIFLDSLKSVTDKINEGVKKETELKLNNFGTKNSENTKYSSQKKVPPFSASEITNII
jgi:nucleoid DNA-binding protein